MRKRKQYNKEYYQRNRDELLTKGKKRSKAWHQVPENKEHHNVRVRNKIANGCTLNRDANRRSRLKLKHETMDAYGGQCKCCGETELEFLTIDHINNDGAKHRKSAPHIRGGGALYRWLRKEGYPKDRFQCMCMNCNWSKRLGGVCIHQRPF